MGGSFTSVCKILRSMRFGADTEGREEEFPANELSILAESF